MELIGLLSKVIKENITTKKILLEYPESTVKKLVIKFSKETEDSEEEIRKNIADFERFKSTLNNEDKDIFRHSYDKIKKLIKDKATKQESKKNLEGMTQDYITKYKGADLQMVKMNIKKFFEIKSQLPQLKEFKKDLINYNPSELNALVDKYFSRFNNEGVNELIVAIAQKFHEKSPEEDVMTVILPRAKRFVRHYNLFPLNMKLSAFMNFHEFEIAVDGYAPMEENEYTTPEIDTSDVDIAYEDDNVLIFAPDQKHKCINIRKKFAPTRTWCTSQEAGSNLYYNYRLNQNLTLYYIINKNLSETNLNYASVILVDKYGEMRLADGSNNGRYAGSTIIPWSEILTKIPVLKDKEQYLKAKPFSDVDQNKMQKYKSYNLTTTDPIAELGGYQEVEMWLELRSPDLRSTKNGDEIFKNLPEEMQKKYIGLGNELSAGMVRALTPSAMSYYLSKKKEKILQKNLGQLNENDMELILSREMRPYLKSLKAKFKKELDSNFSSELVQIVYPNDTNSKYARMFGLNELFDLIPKDTTMITIENKSNDSIILEIPKTIGTFRKLFTLSLDNVVREIPEEIGECVDLSFLNVTNCKELTTLPATLINCPCLSFISKGGSGLEIENIPDELAQYLIPSDQLFLPDFPEHITNKCSAEMPNVNL